ncbi:hypothetical protein [Jannaschia helgolandensis]|uniref:Uncharacterized protein n=1 Tax=Jannaschia helgolandensis TaxID=188906 RepID=A0A1H7S6A9_9RHOB|nr:hypothetical protein [Jannaschia helgolandensis]SEL67057.1 hypothetical protein SAMN04488526_3253 [Jannaschia helgolandensis]
MSAWAIAGQSLSLVVGGAGLGIGIAFGGILWIERDRAGDLQDALLTETIEHYQTVAELATCQAVTGLLREGREIDDAIPNDLGGFVLPDAWRVRPSDRPTD